MCTYLTILILLGMIISLSRVKCERHAHRLCIDVSRRWRGGTTSAGPCRSHGATWPHCPADRLGACPTGWAAHHARCCSPQPAQVSFEGGDGLVEGMEAS